MYLFKELSSIHKFAGAIRNSLHALLPLAIRLQVLVLNVVPSTHYKHIGLENATRKKAFIKINTLYSGGTCLHSDLLERDFTSWNCRTGGQKERERCVGCIIHEESLIPISDPQHFRIKISVVIRVLKP